MSILLEVKPSCSQASVSLLSFIYCKQWNGGGRADNMAKFALNLSIKLFDQML